MRPWEPKAKRADIAAAPSGADAQSPLTLSENEIWRQVELTNTNSSTVFWKVTILAGEEFTPTIDYHFFARE